MTEFVLSALKIVGLCLAFAMTLLQEKHHSEEQRTESKRRRTIALLMLGLTVAVGAEIADLFNRHQSTAETLERHGQILLGLERNTHPFFPVGIASDFRLPLRDGTKEFRQRLEEAIRHHDSSYEKGTYFNVEGDPILVRFNFESRLFPSNQESSAKKLLEEPIGVNLVVGEVKSTSFGHLTFDTFQSELSAPIRLQLPRVAGAIVTETNEDQYKSTIFEYRPGTNFVTAFLNEVTLKQPASSDGSIVSVTDLAGKEMKIYVSSEPNLPPLLRRLILRFSDQELIEMVPIPTHRTDLEGRDEYTCTVPKLTGAGIKDHGSAK
jgi:hypothetical protein